MSRKIRLGPLAIFLTVVAIVLSTLAVLTQATTQADLTMAKRFADVTETRYALEEEGQRYLMEADEALISGKFDPAELGLEKTDGGELTHTISRDGYQLTIQITEPDDEGSYDVVRWKIAREWNAADPFANVWQGPAGK